ncbi:TetR/AcrR family transcriptional regulator [Mycobacteroides sp. LB1]|uniref:TetR/AcrR family transcriptional regulator n=1 Tax=Mycobacteroides sp. LB1 TaxID=2750814 RepID=UPI0015DE8CAB|nr:TetR/AcrR family transcriptional regulator [Mycobacteroides sp. LB1]
MGLSRRQVSADGTRRALMESARDCFSTTGYEATTVEALTSRAQVSKGAFYRHFVDKKAAFEAVFLERLVWVAALIGRACEQLDGQPRGAGIGIVSRVATEFAALSVTDPVHRELLRQAPEVLGADRYQAIDDEHVLPPLVGLLTSMVDRGELVPTVPVATTARLLLRVLCSGNTLVCQAANPHAMLGEVVAASGAFFSGLMAADLRAELAATNQ